MLSSTSLCGSQLPFCASVLCGAQRNQWHTTHVSDGNRMSSATSAPHYAARWALTVTQLLGAAMSSAELVADPAWLGNHCCSRKTSWSSGVTVCMHLFPMLSCCSQLISSVTTACRDLLEEGFTAFCWTAAAVCSPAV